MVKVLNEVMSEFVENYRSRNYFNEENHNFIDAEANKIIECTQKCLKMRNSVVEEVLDDMQEAMIQDYIENSKAKMQEVMEEEVVIKEDSNDNKSKEKQEESRMEK